MRRGEAGVTLIEIMVAVTLLSLLTVGMVMAIRIGLSAYSRTEAKLMDNRRVAGAQRILQQEMEGLIPAFVACGAGRGGSGSGPRAVLFQGGPDSMWLASAFSIQSGWRGQPQVLALFVISGEKGGVRLVVNEMPYNGPAGAAQYCAGTRPVAGGFAPMAVFRTPEASSKSFVLADQLAYCRISYYTPAGMYETRPPTWQPDWHGRGWPRAIRIDMAPLTADPSRLQPISITAPIRIRRDPDQVYVDGN
jgi:hypothetical protein